LRRGGKIRPYPYQTALADSGLPEVLRAPTGAGKTLAAVLPWLYRRIAHPDPAVRTATPHWLVVVLPQRTLVEQTIDTASRWVEGLGAPAAVHVLMGGEDNHDLEWKMHPECERIFVGTQDMVLSRLLMRGFAESRATWPMSFGLLHAGVQFVFDEVQLMGPGSAVNAAVASAAYACTAMSSRRRSTRSASAPANSANISVGVRLAVCTSATTVGLACLSTRNHCAPTICIHVPMFDVKAAMKRPRNTPIRSGAHVDAAVPAGPAPSVAIAARFSSGIDHRQGHSTQMILTDRESGQAMQLLDRSRGTGYDAALTRGLAD
jgi:DEAD/DEAH box helicase